MKVESVPLLAPVMRTAVDDIFLRMKLFLRYYHFHQAAFHDSLLQSSAHTLPSNYRGSFQATCDNHLPFSEFSSNGSLTRPLLSLLPMASYEACDFYLFFSKSLYREALNFFSFPVLNFLLASRAIMV
jgi:hypothetical protein